MKPEKINRKMVEAALIMKQINGETLQTVPANVDLKHVYCCNFSKSVIKGIDIDMFCCDLIKGDGGELSNSSGSAPKFNSISSSASLAVSTFAPWKTRLRKLSIDLGSHRLTGFEKMEFEHVAKTQNTNSQMHPNLDVWLGWEDGILGIECKFCEFLQGKIKKHDHPQSYMKMVMENNYGGPWITSIEKIIDAHNKGINERFDAVQIIKHYYGLMNSNKSEKHLLYLYWHPDNEDWMDTHPFNIHMRELKEFSELVSQATDVHFHYLSFNELWNQWGLTDNDEVQKHARALKQKYQVTIK